MLSAVVNRHLVTNWIATPLIAELATRWVADGTAVELVRWQRQALRQRQEVVAEMLAGIPYKAHREGLHLWLPLETPEAEELFVAQARLRGVAVAPGRSFQMGSIRQPAVRVSVGSTTEAELRTGLKVIANLHRSDPEPLLLAI